MGNIEGFMLQSFQQLFDSGYSEAGASTVKRSLKGFNAPSSSPNEDINYNQQTLRQRGRMLYMSSPVAASAINTNRAKVIGTGLKLQSTIDYAQLGMTPEEAEKWQRVTEKEFSIWAEKRQNVDAIGLSDFYDLQQIVTMSWLASGDVFVLFQRQAATPINPYSLRLRLVEADRIRTPLAPGSNNFITDGENPDNRNKIFDGVEVDANGRVVAYHICNMYPRQLKSLDGIEWRRVSAFGRKSGLPNVLHVMSAERPDQYRGVTYLAPVIESLLNISRYTQSELMAALVQSFFTAWIQTNTDPGRIPINEVGYGDGEGYDNPPDSDLSKNENEYEMGPGTITHLQPGEEIKFGNPNIPTEGFDAFFKVICREIGAALDIPYDTLLKEFNASYSASRAALMEAWEGFRQRRRIIVSKFCQPVYEAWLAEAVAIGRIKAPGFFLDPFIRAAWSRAQWQGPVQGQLDPIKEVNANILAVQHGFKTHSQVTMEMGTGDWLANVETLKQETEAIRAAYPVADGEGQQ